MTANASATNSTHAPNPVGESLLTAANRLDELWQALVPFASPGRRQISLWVLRFGTEITALGISRISHICERQPQKFADADGVHRFATGVMSRLAESRKPHEVQA